MSFKFDFDSDTEITQNRNHCSNLIVGYAYKKIRSILFENGQKVKELETAQVERAEIARIKHARSFALRS